MQTCGFPDLGKFAKSQTLNLVRVPISASTFRFWSKEFGPGNSALVVTTLLSVTP